MEPRISIVTLGVSDLEKSVRFYQDGLRWPLSSASEAAIAFFRTGGIVLALFPKEELAKDAEVSSKGSGFHGFTLAHNVRKKEDVDETLEFVRKAGGKILKPAHDAFWGGRSGYFADPDDFLWEVAWNPHFPMRKDGSIELPV